LTDIFFPPTQANISCGAIKLPAGSEVRLVEFVGKFYGSHGESQRNKIGESETGERKPIELVFFFRKIGGLAST
jgi:hypothetical protein